MTPKPSNLPPEHLLGLQQHEHDALRTLLTMLEDTARSLEDCPDEVHESLLDALCLVHYLGRAENHHLREERVLFPALAARGVEAALLDGLRAQHQELWELQRRLRERASDELAHRDPSGVATLARRLVTRMRAHLQLEDRVLFPLALESIPEATWEDLHERGRGLPVRTLAPSRPDVA
jgi:hemerythrin-like domain-containing protein